MSISRKLKDLIVAFGGAQSAAAIPGSRIDNLIGTLAAFIRTGDFGVLPAVTGSDNGKLLGVRGGAWGAVAAPVTVPYDVPVTVTEGEGDALTASTDKTFAEVKAAFLAGRNVRAVIALPESTLSAAAPVTVADDLADPTALTFGVLCDMSGNPEAPAPTLLQMTFSAEGLAFSALELTPSAD